MMVKRKWPVRDKGQLEVGGDSVINDGLVGEAKYYKRYGNLLFSWGSWECILVVGSAV